MENKKPETSVESQNEQLREMNYNASEDIFNKEEHVPLDGDGNPILNHSENAETSDLDEDLDVPGAELDDQMQEIGDEDEENNYWSLGGDNHEDLEQSEDF